MFKELLEMKIMIVDDDSITQKILKGFLIKEGYHKIMSSLSGDQALDLIKKEPPDLILLDIFMPGIDGHEVCKRLKADQSTVHIPVIMVTGGASQEDESIKKSFNSGATDFITKPFRKIEFLARVKSSLTIKRNHDLLSDELKKRLQAEKKNEELINKLTQALSEIKTLQGIFPICSNCKKIRDDEGHWNRMESYIEKHSDVAFSHSMCPLCTEKLYGEDDWYIEMNKGDK